MVDDREDVKRAFQELDKGGSKAISQELCAQVLQQVMPHWSEEHIATILAAAPVDASGYVHYDKFIDWVYDVDKQQWDEQLSSTQGTSMPSGKPKAKAKGERFKSVVSEAQEKGAEELGESRHLVLNFDINKTILMSDAVQNKTVSEVVNEVLADAGWGVVRDDTWTLSVMEPSVRRPKVEGLELLSYNEWLCKVHPGGKNKKTRSEIVKKFTAPGGDGEPLADYGKKLEEGLIRPDGESVQIIPAFFELMEKLKSNKRSFTLVFRTFGMDLEAIAEELNMFCEGRHPLSKPGIVFDGSDGDVDYRVYPGDKAKSGTFYRDDSAMAIVWGTWWSPEKEAAPSLSCYDGKRCDGSSGDCLDIFTGSVNKVGVHVRKRMRQPGTLALRDYYVYWKDKGMTSLGGKPLFFKFSAFAKLHEIFFDDNIRFSDPYIVDPIDMTRADRKTWAAPMLQTHMCRAEPLLSVYDKQYFIKEVARMENAYTRKLAARKNLERLVKGGDIVRAARMEAGKKNRRATDTYDPWADFKSTFNENLLVEIDQSDIDSSNV